MGRRRAFVQRSSPAARVNASLGRQGPGDWVTKAAPGFVRVGLLGALAPTPGLAAVLRPAVEAGMRGTVQEGVRRLQQLPANSAVAECLEVLEGMADPKRGWPRARPR